MNCLTSFVLVCCRAWVSEDFSTIEVFYFIFYQVTYFIDEKEFDTLNERPVVSPPSSHAIPLLLWKTPVLTTASNDPVIFINHLQQLSVYMWISCYNTRSNGGCTFINTKLSCPLG